MSQQPPAKPGPSLIRRVGRLITTLIVLLFGFLCGWIANEAEKQGWDARNTWTATRARAALLHEQISAAFSSAPAGHDGPAEAAAPPPPASLDEGESPAKEAARQEELPDGDAPPLQADDEVDLLVQMGDTEFTEGQKLFTLGKTVENAKESDRYYERAQKNFERAGRHYQDATKLAPENQNIQRRLSRALEQIYWCKKLRRL